ncbi:MAG: hypothetical protein IPP51_01480 [Bacteroidetes bacterium]|nr:hypothetical protein [Bacteroidota bacterium]
MCNNYLYDQINMGSANFVNYSFQNLINRNATISELANGITMVEGNNSILFLQTGSSKVDFLNILTNSSSYYEAQVVFAYQRYLQRTPNTLEMADGTQTFQSTGDFIQVLKSILSTNEFIGIR